jgi:hypothetical protein
MAVVYINFIHVYGSKSINMVINMVISTIQFFRMKMNKITKRISLESDMWQNASLFCRWKKWKVMDKFILQKNFQDKLIQCSSFIANHEL